jgi:hypothetical protein
MTWLQDQQATIEAVAAFFPHLGQVGGLTNMNSTGQATHARISSPQPPIDPRPIDLENDVKAYSKEALSFTRGTLRTGETGPMDTPARLRFVAGLLGDLDAADPELTRILAKRARKLKARWEAIVGNIDNPWRALDQACSECEGRLWVNRTDYHVECEGCGATWTLDDLRRVFEAVTQ